ncbi:hypothetical protein D3C77_576870 [compost metagenome]
MVARCLALVEHQLTQYLRRTRRGAETNMLMAQRQPQPRVLRRLPDHRPAVGQGGATAQPRTRIQPLTQRKRFTRPRFRHVQLRVAWRGVAGVQLHSR